MLRVSRLARIGTFSMFMIQEKKNPILTSLPVSQRGKKLGEMYRALTPQEIEKLNVKAKKYKPSAASIRRKAQRIKRRSQATFHLKLKGAEEYNRFLKVMHERYGKLPEADRFAKLIERFERSYGKPLPALKKKAAKSSRKTKKSMKKAIKKHASKPKTHKKKTAKSKKVKKVKKVKAHKKAKTAKKRHSKKK